MRDELPGVALIPIEELKKELTDISEQHPEFGIDI